MLGSLLVVCSAFLNAINQCLLRMMKNLHYCISPYYYGVLGSFVSLTFILHSEAQNFGGPSRLGVRDLWIFFGIGLLSAIGAVTKSLAFQYEKVSTLSMLRYTNLIYSLLADMILFQSHIYVGEIVGATLILSSTLIVTLLKFS